MFSLLTFVFSLILNLFKSEKQLLLHVSLQQKELEILKRQIRKKRLPIRQTDRIILSILTRSSEIKESISIVKPETVLRWQRHHRLEYG